MCPFLAYKSRVFEYDMRGVCLFSASYCMHQDIKSLLMAVRYDALETKQRHIQHHEHADAAPGTLFSLVI